MFNQQWLVLETQKVSPTSRWGFPGQPDPGRAGDRAPQQHGFPAGRVVHILVPVFFVGGVQYNMCIYIYINIILLGVNLYNRGLGSKIL